MSDAASQPSVIVIDHTSAPGGAELALPRIARHARLPWTFAFLEPLDDRLPFDPLAVTDAPPQRLNLVQQILRTRRLLRAHESSTVVSNTLRAAVFVSLLKPRAQTHLQILHDGVDAASLGRGKRLLTSFVFAVGVTAVLPNSRWTASTVPARFRSLLGTPVYSPSGATGTESFPRERPRRTPLRLLSLSRIVSWKGIHVILDALEILSEEVPSRDIELTIAGNSVMGPEKYVEDLKIRASQLPFTVRFLGHRSDVAQVLDNHDVLVHASTRPEPFGQVVVQGLAHGLIVLASRAGGPAEIIEDGVTGLLHEPGDANSMARAIRAILDRPDLGDSLAAAGTGRVHAFTDSACTELLENQIIKASAESTR
ncbi:glycosyltransferase family 4 protein [Frigoribacterium sp. 2-23]|uniref:glycosyltransferase family 4 protein n=1 Tax=Frigoribacterium sp. 2-23 TaxID=3415006 RepID=UPI003C6FD645